MTYKIVACVVDYNQDGVLLANKVQVLWFDNEEAASQAYEFLMRRTGISAILVHDPQPRPDK